MSSGVYDPLSPLPNSIRVVRIAPTNSFGVDRVVCQLNETTWDACDYEALSYCWGKRGPKDLADILLNGDTVAVTKDLHEALRQLSLPDRIRTIWVGTVCRLKFHGRPWELSTDTQWCSRSMRCASTRMIKTKRPPRCSAWAKSIEMHSESSSGSALARQTRRPPSDKSKSSLVSIPMTISSLCGAKGDLGLSI